MMAYCSGFVQEVKVMSDISLDHTFSYFHYAKQLKSNLSLTCAIRTSAGTASC